VLRKKPAFCKKSERSPGLIYSGIREKGGAGRLERNQTRLFFFEGGIIQKELLFFLCRNGGKIPITKEGVLQRTTKSQRALFQITKKKESAGEAEVKKRRRSMGYRQDQLPTEI